MLEDVDLVFNITSNATIKQLLDIVPDFSISNNKIWLLKIILLPKTHAERTERTKSCLVEKPYRL